jgi:hypothetical protein
MERTAIIDLATARLLHQIEDDNYWSYAVYQMTEVSLDEYNPAELPVELAQTISAAIFMAFPRISYPASIYRIKFVMHLLNGLFNFNVQQGVKGAAIEEIRQKIYTEEVARALLDRYISFHSEL